MASSIGLFLHVDAIEFMAPERRDLVAHHFLAHRLANGGMRDGEPRRLLLEDLLHVLVDRGALLLVGQGPRLEQSVIEVLIAPFREILGVGLAVGAAAEQEEEVVGIAIVAGPSKKA